MKVAIIYSSKHGTTEKVAQLIASSLHAETVLINLSEQLNPDISGFELIIAGTSVYAGKPMPAMHHFYVQKMQELQEKPLVLFVCGMEPVAEKQIAELKAAYPAELYDHAVIKDFLGGEFLFEKMNFFERFIVKRIAKTKTSVSAILDDKVQALAEAVNRLY